MASRKTLPARPRPDRLRSILRNGLWPNVGPEIRDIILLAETDAAVSEDRVGGHQVEVELREHPVAGVFGTVHVERDSIGQHQFQRPRRGSVEAAGFYAPEKIER